MEKMELLTAELEVRFTEIGFQENIKDPIVVAKFFLPGLAVRWYACAYYPDEQVFFGYVTGLSFDEYGYFSLTELDELEHPYSPFLFVERDLSFTETPMSKIIAGQVV